MIRSMQFDPNKAIYTQIAEYYYQQICSGELAPGDKLPSVRETAQRLQVNPNTVSRAYLEMDREQITFSKRGQGTFVTTDLTVIKQLKETLADAQMQALITFMRKLGFSNQEISASLERSLKEMGNQ
ncbi:GntR family transcriptional regulator [Shouchella clausii]|nr:GntR family transcriptional regulator [Shouchella clausii]SPU22351.1 GntR family transcriptional regulator [Niallia circulans]MCM3550104.1 GntR family transcriptional regulator [Shouchella clausii]MCR1289074.1 GntR family transcriptional regulator [Shouchella clausii]MCY1106353.1 GntR family transcriptional regulator [Shouchella clausii]MEB5474965.1 GntR family transcriptional regulator [Shouchella clausii]